VKSFCGIGVVGSGCWETFKKEDQNVSDWEERMHDGHLGAKSECI
jgi:hypothetical protein